MPSTPDFAAIAAKLMGTDGRCVVGSGSQTDCVRQALVDAYNEGRSRTRTARLRITIEGGEAFERVVIANEIEALMESNDVAVTDVSKDKCRVVHDSEEHHDHLQYIATNSRNAPLELEVRR